MEYAGFWRRFGAFWIDFTVLLPLMGISYFFMNRYRLFQLYWFIPGALFGIWFSVYLVKRYGGTPGKLLLKIRIAMLDGSPITFKAAALRHSVLFTLSIATSMAMAMACLAITDEQYLPLSYLEKSVALVKLSPPWYKTIELLMQIWIWSEFISMLFNKKRRAIHDFIANTVVVKTVPQQHIL